MVRSDTRHSIFKVEKVVARVQMNKLRINNFNDKI